MAGSYSYTVILDACVLYPAPLRDLLLSLATEGVFRARWTAIIQDEWTRNVLANYPDVKPDALQSIVALMNQAVEDCLVENFEYLIESLALPDSNDRHVLAAAIAAHADAIVTFNLKDFPETIAKAHGIEILHPDDFLVAQYDLAPVRVLKIVKALRERLMHSFRDTVCEMLPLRLRSRLRLRKKPIRRPSTTNAGIWFVQHASTGRPASSSVLAAELSSGIM
jgi:predicted nucleic acid-binding protein